MSRASKRRNQRSEPSAARTPYPELPRSESVTVRPPFDPIEFARDTESRVRLAAGAADPLPTTMPPPPGLPEYSNDLVPPSAGGDAGDAGVASATLAGAIPRLAVTPEELDWFDLAPRARELLRYVNGADCLAVVSSRSGVDPSEAASIMCDLARDGLVTVRPGSRR